jgi:hypothetical protein
MPIDPGPEKTRFHFYGLTIAVGSTDADLVEQVRRDFAYFHVPAAKAPVAIHVEMRLTEPPYTKLPAVKASFITPRNVCFRSKNIMFIDYFGKGLVIFDRSKKSCIVYGTDRDMVHEIVYLFFLSTVGEFLDNRGIHRIHALGMSYKRRGMLLILPSGGGKSTMALELLRRPDFLLIGEDTPLIDRRGNILPFPLRIGVRPGNYSDIPSQHLRTVRRMEFDPKTLIDIDYFQGRLGKLTAPHMLLIGERNLGAVADIAPISRGNAFNALVKYMIVGLGIYQGLEFLLERSEWNLLSKGGVAGSRCYNGLRLLMRSRPYRFVMGRNISKNLETFLEFVDETCG